MHSDEHELRYKSCTVPTGQAAKERGGEPARGTVVDVPACDPLFALVVDFRPVAAEAQQGPLPRGLTPLTLRYPPWTDPFYRQTSFRT
jgi:hypothetical protein